MIIREATGADALRFCESLGFEPSHRGLKRVL